MLSRNIIITLTLWFLFSLIGGLTGFFAATKEPPLVLGLSIVLPVVIFVFLYRPESELFRQIEKINLRYLILAQSWRIMGLLFIVDYYRGLMPAGFAFPAGLGDIAIGLTAPLMAYLVDSSYRHKDRVLKLWNILGITDLVLAVTLGLLHSQTPIGVMTGTTTTFLMGVFPRNLIPTFLVPLFVIVHIITLKGLKRNAPASRPKQTRSYGTL